MIATFFPIFDVPVFWPILLLYFFVLFFITMKRQVKHMIKHKYIPFDLGKKVNPSHAGKSKIGSGSCRVNTTTLDRVGDLRFWS